MTLLLRPLFIEALQHLSQSGTSENTLIYMKINHALQVASLLGGSIVEQQLFNAVQSLICSKVKHLTGLMISRLSNNGFGIIANLSIEDSVDVAEGLANLLDQQTITIGDHSFYPKLIIGDNNENL
ncbi:MAG: hypothetical protein K9L79_11555 [Methylobacter tundripaludum]|uniref:GGDEF domain-containing protein n=2 Tax=Methylobacter tundripaludum TaxID=173365 RepID=A0A2S6GTV9_9GAMM|nr:hypothetical protein [Methylobacter tundripaludum]MCK9635516.1 hypothetical protein [Methylobacter tundripaludum]PPK68644.1 hypothetical protein B0F88_11152 [Methylobacter tundripaludum]